ncbi:hypothetical protein [Catenulispora sp. EB89]|uniref:hypothetical protein n=1 Tax=Catenulispora sp. EB89 TaxID=3156257 RepID=UPI0035138917
MSKTTSASAKSDRASNSDTASKNDTASEATTSDTTKAEAEKPVQSTQKTDQKTGQKTDQKTEEPGNRISVTIPLDSAALGLAVKAATLPVTAVKKVAQNRNGIPAYVAVGGLAVIGAVEWPVAAVGGLSLAALRRWGPLKPAQEPESKQESKPASKKSA